jgi:hypothetical protein
MLAAALAIPLTGVSAVALSTPAWAAVKITCTSFNGSVASGQVQATGCTGGNTGGSSQSLSISVLAAGGVVPWTQTPNTTTFGSPTLASTSATKCPGYVKKASSNLAAEKFSGVVTADTGNGIKVPGKYSGAVCISNDANGDITALKPLKIS